MVQGDAHVVKIYLAGAAALPAKLVLIVACLVARRAGRHHEPGQSAECDRIKFTCLAHDETVITHAAVGCEDLASVDDPLVTVPHCGGLIFRHIEDSAGLCCPVGQEVHLQ